MTNEHIISDNVSTSGSDSFWDSGDVTAVLGLSCESPRGVDWCETGAGFGGGMFELDAFAVEFFVDMKTDLSANRLSSAPRSVFPESSSDSNPDKRNNDSIRPSLFSNPSIYFALNGSNSVKRFFPTEYQLNFQLQ